VALAELVTRAGYSPVSQGGGPAWILQVGAALVLVPGDLPATRELYGTWQRGEDQVGEEARSAMETALREIEDRLANLRATEAGSQG